MNVQGILASIRRNAAALEEAHERSKTVTRSDEMKGIREKMQDDVDEVNKTAHQVKNRLERLDKLNEQALSKPVSRNSMTTTTTCTAMHCMLVPSTESNDMLSHYWSSTCCAP